MSIRSLLCINIRAWITVLCATFLVILFPLKGVTYQEPSKVPKGTCSPDHSKNYQEISVNSITEKINNNKRIHLINKIVTGPLFDLSRQIVKEPILIKDSIFNGKVDFRDVFFLNTVDMSGSCFKNTVDIERAQFNKDSIWENTEFHGPFSHHAVIVGGSLIFDKAKFFNKAIFTHSKIGHTAGFAQAEFHETIWFNGVVIVHYAVFEGAVFTKDAIFERTDIGESAYFRERQYEQGLIPAAKFGGVADFKATKIWGQANFIGVTFEGEVRMTRAQFDEARFSKTKFIQGRDKDANEVWFNDAQFGLLDFGNGGVELADFAAERILNFSGFTFNRTPTPVNYVLKILKQHKPYDRQPYTILEKFYRNKGDMSRANHVYYTRRRVEGDKISLFHLPSWSWDRVQRYIFGYGVKAIYPIMWLIGLISISTLLLVGYGSLIRRVRGDVLENNIEYASLSISKRLLTSFVVSIDLLIPKVALRIADRWTVSHSTILVFRFALPITYHQFATGMRFVAWIIITLSLSVFSIQDLIRH